MLHRDAAPGIHRIEEAATNWYLVEDDERVTIVDTGFPRSWSALHEALGRLGRRPEDVAAVVLTHAHFDHMGFAERARRELGVPVWAHEREVPVTRHPWHYDHERSRLPYVRHGRFVRIFAAMGAKGALWVRGVEEVRTYGSDDTLDVPGRPHVVFTPGHTYGHCALHFADRDAVIAGDALVMLDPYTGREGPCIVAGAATADSDLALDSLDALADTGAGVLLTGHGPPFRGDPRAAVRHARTLGPA
jgi:glyoxylase-like metal-dependent hydrolase (beta-lactamase superfamily II)